MGAGRRLLAALRVDPPDDPRTLFEFRRVGPVPAWCQVVLGPILGWVTLRCRSVWPAVILHYANYLTYFQHA